MKKILTILILILTFPTSAFADTYLFVRESCSHCQSTEKYLKEQDLIRKNSIKIIDIMGSEENMKLYLKKANELDYKDLQVPMLLVDNTIYDGENEIKSFFGENDSIQPIDENTNLSESEANILKEIIKTEVASSNSPKNTESQATPNSNINKDTINENSDLKIKIIGLIVIAFGISLFVKTIQKVRKLK
jgi:glutaredoxin